MRSFFSKISPLIGFIAVYLSAQLIKANLVWLFGIDNMIDKLAIITGAWLLASLILYSGYIFYNYCSNIRSVSFEENYILKPFEKRRKLCKPLLIGCLVGFVSPLIFSLIYSIRQRSWQIIASTMWLGIVVKYILIPPAIVVADTPRSITILFQLVCGIAAYFAARKNKLEYKSSS